ncbi:MAG: TerB family tellurite resistance protein [Gemmatimonadetes bacterium]|nr:TerB family tellurite resistance protein [Gemmatimonadota bacterium]
MERFLSLIEYTVAASVLISAVSSYLIVNKLWSRRDRQEVAESVSIAAALLGLATGIPFFIQFTMIDHTPWPAVKQGVGILTGLIFVLIGSGLWVRENRGTGFLRLFLRALRLEKRESGDLIKALVQPKGADHIIEVLRRMAALDSRVDELEARMIRDFAARWQLHAPDLDEGSRDEQRGLLAVREAVAAYLAIDPPADQAAELVDLLAVFVGIDDDVSADEATVMDEIRGMVAGYVGGADVRRALHEVVIVPQDTAQFDAVRALIPGAETKEARGGRVFSVGTFFSPAYAEQICQKYIALGLFTTHVQGETGVREPQPV